MNKINKNIFVAFIALFVWGVVYILTPTCLPGIEKSIVASSSVLGYLLTTVMIGYFISSIVGGILSDFIGKMLVVKISILFMIVGSVFFFCPINLFLIFTGALLMGLGGGACECTSMAFISDNSEDNNRTFNLSIGQLCYSVATIIIPVLIAYILKVFGNWQFAYIMACIFCIITFFLMLNIKDVKYVLENKEKVSYRDLANKSLIVICSLVVFLYVMGTDSIGIWISKYMTDYMKTTQETGALYIALFYGAMGLGRLIVALIAKHVKNMYILLASVFVAMVSSILFLLSKGFMGASVFSILVGCAMGAVWPTTLGIAGEIFKDNTGKIFGIIMGFGGLSMFITPALVGNIADMFGLKHAMFLSPICSLLNLIVILFLVFKVRNKKNN